MEAGRLTDDQLAELVEQSDDLLLDIQLIEAQLLDPDRGNDYEDNRWRCKGTAARAYKIRERRRIKRSISREKSLRNKDNKRRAELRRLEKLKSSKRQERISKHIKEYELDSSELTDDASKIVVLLKICKRCMAWGAVTEQEQSIIDFIRDGVKGE
jgi:hypothetical protein